MKKKTIILILSGLFIVALVFAFIGARMIFGKNIQTGGREIVLYIPEGATFGRALDTINAQLSITHPRAFVWIAEKKHYSVNVKPGRYLIENDLSYNELINMLRSGRQAAVKVTFNNIRTLNDLAGKVGKQIAADSASIIAFLNDPSSYSADGFTRETIISVFIPNTYQLFWNTTPEGFYRRMLREYKAFWNDERMQKAALKNLTPLEVSILASIVDDEVVMTSEKPKIAGVYINRLKRGIPLQACPTIKFALNDFTITRVLTKYLSVESPYNTYKYKGFPPGPICCPSIEGIDAVLNAAEHDYLFFAAKSDFSGYHNFSRTLSEHNRYAAEYQRELNKRKIYK